MMRLLSRPGLGMGPFAMARLGNPFQPYLGQDISDLFDPETISAEIVNLMGRLPENLLGQYRAKYDECQRKLGDGGVMGLYQGVRCLKNLYEDIRESLRREDERPPPTGTRPPEAGFPWLVVGAVAAVGVGVAVYFVARG
jgi:hypothetical protein